MKLNYTFKGTETNEKLVATLQSKLERLSKLEMKPLESADAVFRLEGKDEYDIELKLHGGNGPLVAHGEGASFLEAIDTAVDRLEVQMKRRKEKVQNHKRH